MPSMTRSHPVNLAPSEPSAHGTFAPLAESIEKPVAPESRTQAARGPRSILLVDDDYRILNLLETWFSAKGFITFRAEDGKRALQFAREFVPDLIITDLELLAESGVAVAAQIRRMHPSVKTILLTGVHFEDPGHDLTFGGTIDKYVRKPASLAQLDSIARGLMGLIPVGSDRT
jgi:CheY-like chemotaxis protein